jgi:hypothetical protein
MSSSKAGITTTVSKSSEKVMEQFLSVRRQLLVEAQASPVDEDDSTDGRFKMDFRFETRSMMGAVLYVVCWHTIMI